MPGAHAGLRPPQPLVSTMVEQPAAFGGADAVHDGAHAPALVEVGARAEDQGAPAGVTDGDRAHAPAVSGDGRGVEAGYVGVVDGREGRADEVGGLAPARPEHERHVVGRRAGALGDDGGGGLGDVEGVGGRVVEIHDSRQAP